MSGNHLPGRLFAPATVLVAALAAGRSGFRPEGYAPKVAALTTDTIRVKTLKRATHDRRSVLALGTVIPGYLSSRGLPPVRGQITITDTGLVFRSGEGAVARFPLVGPLR